MTDRIENKMELSEVTHHAHGFVTALDVAGARGDDPIRIFVVEDDACQRSLLSAILERKGYVVETACDGLQAIRRIRENCCDLAVLDYNLPELDGLAVASLVHDQIAQDVRPKLVAITATPDVLYTQTAAAGPVFDRIVDKSLGLYELISSVDHLLRFSTDPEMRRAAARIL
jgi:CheY-like chemotaxis protein